MGNKQQAPTGVVIECKVQGGYVEMPDGSSEWTNNRNWRTEVISEIYLEPGTLLYTTSPAAQRQFVGLSAVEARLKELNT